jgi:hypothetical protein
MEELKIINAFKPLFVDDKSEKIDLEVDWDESEHGITGLVNGAIALKISSYIGSLQGFSLSEFKASPIRTLYKGERQFSSVRVSGSDTKTLGYIFPIASFYTGKEIPQDKWVQIYASAAIRSILIEGVANSFVRLPDLSNTSIEVEISTLFPEDFAIMILGKEALDHFGLTLESIKLMVQADDFLLYPEEEDLKYTESISEYNERIILKPISQSLVSECPELLWIISSAKREVSLPAKFLSFYQVMEHFLSKIFCQYMQEISKSDMLDNDPWRLREKIAEVAAEKWRLNRLEQCFLKSGYDSTVFKECTQKCKNLLISLGEEDLDKIEKLSWAGSLYRVRNILIHRQLSLLSKENVREGLSEVCEVLMDVCFEILSHYSEENIHPLFPPSLSSQASSPENISQAS